MDHLDTDRMAAGGPPDTIGGIASRAALAALDATLKAAASLDGRTAASEARRLADQATAAAESAGALAALDSLLTLACERIAAAPATHAASLPGLRNS